MANLPWLDPDETIEVLEIMQEAAACMRNTANFTSLRKELRTRLHNQAQAMEDFVQRAKTPRIDDSIMFAVDTMARDKKTKTIVQIVEALEAFVSSYNRRK